MRHTKLHTARYAYIALALFTLLSFQNIESQNKKKKNKKGDTTEAPTRPAKKEKTIAELVKSSKKIEGLFPIYQDTITGSLQMIISDNQIDKEFIYFSQIADGVLDVGRTIRGSYMGSKVVKIEKYFNKIEFVAQNTSFYFDSENPLSKSKEANITNGNMASLQIEAHDKKNGLYLIKADELFLNETFTQVKRPNSPGESPTAFKLGNLNKSKTKINSIKNYSENTNIEVEYVYSSPSVLNNGSNAVADGRNISIKVFQSLKTIMKLDTTIQEWAISLLKLMTKRLQRV
ncbi:MAG TPA: DUF5117 domain-containing protein [Mariniflexile sp.]